jgi:hypothetical protein
MLTLSCTPTFIGATSDLTADPIPVAPPEALAAFFILINSRARTRSAQRASILDRRGGTGAKSNAASATVWTSLRAIMPFLWTRIAKQAGELLSEAISFASDRLQREQRLDCLPPQSGLVTANAIKDPIVKIDEPQKGMGYVTALRSGHIAIY